LVFDKIANSAGKTDCIKRLLTTTQENHFKAKIGIGHTRWATCGEITDVNAHPHFD
jgi:glucosamine--fructose-6-phosphate aminotransferase (isomerizing)